MSSTSASRRKPSARRHRLNVAAHDIRPSDPTIAHSLDLSNPPKFDVISATPDTVVFSVQNSHLAFVNAIRRTILADVETMAIELITLSINSSVLYDEHLAMRIGLIPLLVDPYLFAPYPEPLSDNPGFEPSAADASASIMFSLDVHAPEGGDVVVVRSGDLKFVPLGDQLSTGPLAGRPEPRPVHDDIAIAKLKPGQRISLTALAVRGKGSQHSKWSPGLAFYKMDTAVTVLESPPIARSDTRKAVKGDRAAIGPPSAEAAAEAVSAEAIRDVCPVGVYDIEDGLLVAAHPERCTVCRACVERYPRHVAVELMRERVQFTVESTGQLPPVVIVQRVRTFFGVYPDEVFVPLSLQAFELLAQRFDDASKCLKLSAPADE